MVKDVSESRLDLFFRRTLTGVPHLLPHSSKTVQDLLRAGPCATSENAALHVLQLVSTQATHSDFFVSFICRPILGGWLTVRGHSFSLVRSERVPLGFFQGHSTSSENERGHSAFERKRAHSFSLEGTRRVPSSKNERTRFHSKALDE